MELDDLKNSWEAISTLAEKQQHINLKMIDKMTQTKYNTRMKKIAYPEIIGTIISIIAAGFIGLSFNKLNTPFLQGLGIFVILFLLVLPAISLTMLWQFNKIGDAGKPYVETLKKFAVQKIRFYKFQQISAILSYLLVVALAILLPNLFGGNSINDKKYFWLFTLIICCIFLFFFSRWVLKCYKNTLQQSEDLLKDLES